MIGSVVIPAHNEAGVIERTLRHLGGVAKRGDVEIVVVCNGCDDGTAALARSFEGIHVIELAVGSKPLALNAGDAASSAWPRVYLDADIEMSESSLFSLLNRLSSGPEIAGRPPFVYELAGCSWVVRGFYSARSAMPTLNCRLWGAGVYGVSEEGRQRFGRFPKLLADDLFVDMQFSNDEIAIVEASPVRVRVPRNMGALVGVLTRVYGGQRELGVSRGGSGVKRDIWRLFLSGPRGCWLATIYVLVVVVGRTGVGTWPKRQVWASDRTSR